MRGGEEAQRQQHIGNDERYNFYIFSFHMGASDHHFETDR